MKGKIYHIDSKLASDFLMPKHYSGRKPNVSLAFGWYSQVCEDGLPDEKYLMAVCTFGKPASNTLCDGIAGKEHSHKVYELNRLCRLDEWGEPLSQFVSACLRRIKNSKQWIIVSYADTGMGHNGYIYQACNFIYTGATKKRLEFHVQNGHSRHGSKNSGLRQIRTSKHRYVFLAVKDKRLKKDIERSLRYEAQKYPKGVNRNYDLGFVLKPEVVEYEKSIIRFDKNDSCETLEFENLTDEPSKRGIRLEGLNVN